MLLDELAKPQHYGPRRPARHMIIVNGQRRKNTPFLEFKANNYSGDDICNKKNLTKYSPSDCNKLEHSSGLDTVSTESSYSSLESEELEPLRKPDEEIPIFENQPTKNSRSRSSSSNPPHCSINIDSHNHPALNDLGDCSGISSALSFTPVTSFPSSCSNKGHVRSASASVCPFSCLQRTSLPPSSSSSSASASSTRDKQQTKSVRFGKVQLVPATTLCWEDEDNDDDDDEYDTDDDTTDDDHVSLPTQWFDRSEYSVDEYEEKLLQMKQHQQQKGIIRLQYEKARLEILEYKLMTSITRGQLRSAQNQCNNKQHQPQELENNNSTTTNNTTTATTCTTMNSTRGNIISHHANNNGRTASGTIIVPQLVRSKKNVMIMIPPRWRRWRRAAIKKRKRIQRLLRDVIRTRSATKLLLTSSSSSSQESPPLYQPLCKW